ncbi:hypothetical protein ACOMHN_052121 [Nucella lapillus]
MISAVVEGRVGTLGRAVEEVEGSERRVSTSGKAMEGPERRVSTSGKAMEGPERRVSTSGKATEGPERRVSTSGKGMEGVTRRVSISCKETEGPEQRASTSGKAMEGPERRVSTSGKGMEGPERRVSTSGKATEGPERRVSTSGKGMEGVTRRVSTSGKALAEEAEGLEEVPLKCGWRVRRSSLKHHPMHCCDVVATDAQVALVGFRSGSMSGEKKPEEEDGGGGGGGGGGTGLSAQATGILSAITTFASNSVSGETGRWYSDQEDSVSSNLPLSEKAELSSLPVITPAGLQQTTLATATGAERPDSPAPSAPGAKPAAPNVSVAAVVKDLASQPLPGSPDKKMSRAQPKGTVEYKVCKEDTLEKIAAHFDVTPSELKKLNRLSFHMVFENQILYIPDPNYIPSTPPTPDPFSPPQSPASNKPKLDIPIVKMTEKSSLRVPGPEEPLPAPPASAPPVSNRSPFALTRTLSEGGEPTSADEEYLERFLKLSAQMISEGFEKMPGKLLVTPNAIMFEPDEKMPGTLLVTPNAIMFEPDVTDDRVIEEGAEHYGAVVYMDTVLSAAIYQDLSALRFHTRCSSEDKLSEKPQVYHGDVRARSASTSDLLDCKPSSDPATAAAAASGGGGSSSLAQPVSSSKSASSLLEPTTATPPFSVNVTAFPASPPPLLPAGEGRAAESREGSESVGGVNGDVGDSSTSGARADGSWRGQDCQGVVDGGQEGKQDGFAGTATSGSSSGSSRYPNSQTAAVQGTGKDANSHPPPSLHIEQQPADQTSTTRSSEGQGSSLKPGEEEEEEEDLGDTSPQSVRPCEAEREGENGGERDTGGGGGGVVKEGMGDGGSMTPDKEGGEEEGGGGVRIGNIVYLPVEESSDGKMVVRDTNNVLQTSDSLLDPGKAQGGGGRGGAGAKPRPPPLSSLGVDITDGTSLTPTEGLRSRASSEAFSPLRSSAQHLSNLVNYATGFFRSTPDDRAQVKDINEGPPDRSLTTPDILDSGSGGGGGGGGGKVKGSQGLMAKLQSAECRFMSAIRADERPELFRKISDLLPHHEDIHKQPALYFHLRVDTEECDRRVAASTPCESHRHQMTKPHYWFSVPRNKGDHLYAFFIHWRPDLYGDDDINPEDRGFVVVDRVDVTERGESLPFLDDHFGPQLSTSFKKDWEIVSREELRRRASQAYDLEQTIMPETSEESAILTDEHILELAGRLPARTVGYHWSLVYSTGHHGFSLKRLYRELCHLDSPILLVLQDTDDVVFGAYLSDPPRLSDHFYGTGTCQLWSFCDKLQVFGWSGDNGYFIKGDETSLSLGASHGTYGLWLDSDLYHGHSQECSTFHNCVLSGCEDFILKALEAWAFLSC